MGSWVAIAAGAAGYIAKRWQSPSREKRISSEYPDQTEQIQDKSIPVKRLTRGRNVNENVVSSRDKQISEDSNPSEVMVCTPCDYKQLTDINMYDDCYLQSILSLVTPDSKIVEIKSGFDDEYRPIIDVDDCSGVFMDQISPRSRHASLQLIRPSISMESCLMATQFCNPAPLPSMMVKPLRKSDSFGRKIGDVLHKLHKLKSPLGQETISGILPLPNVGSVEVVKDTEVKIPNVGSVEVVNKIPNVGSVEVVKDMEVKIPNAGSVEVVKNMEVKNVDNSLTNSNCGCETGENRENSNLLAGYPEAAFIFTLGISMGLISSFLVNKKELNKLNGLLKQTENLVQDLQEELELKDSMTVKELAIEDQDSQDMYDNNNNRELHEQKTEEHSEAMSKIEAELQAELEWLELNIGYSNPQAKSSDPEENQDLIPELVEGELRVENSGRKSDSQPYADRDGTGASTPYYVNYAVSAHELSLRLHKVIESRLEERISELETALECSERKLQSTKPRHEISIPSNEELRPFSWCWDSSPGLKKKEVEERTENGIEQAIIISLSEEEGYDDMKLMKNDTESSSRGKKVIDGLMEEDVLCNQYWDFPHISLGDESVNICFPDDDESLLEQDNLDLDLDFVSEEEEDDDDDERRYEELLIIKQIVEKTRKDSTALLSAQKALLLMDQTQH